MRLFDDLLGGPLFRDFLTAVKGAAAVTSAAETTPDTFYEEVSTVYHCLEEMGEYPRAMVCAFCTKLYVDTQNSPASMDPVGYNMVLVSGLATVAYTWKTTSRLPAYHALTSAELRSTYAGGRLSRLAHDADVLTDEVLPVFKSIVDKETVEKTEDTIAMLRRLDAEIRDARRRGAAPSPLHGTLVTTASV